jgi:hypothetical protein
LVIVDTVGSIAVTSIVEQQVCITILENQKHARSLRSMTGQFNSIYYVISKI